jgi:hypothetical protein
MARVREFARRARCSCSRRRACALRLAAWDLPVSAQAADAIRGKRQISGGGASLAIEDASMTASG